MSYRTSSLGLKDALATTAMFWMPWISTLAYCQQSPPACGSGSGECCSANRTPGCQEEACCTAVCACDPFCCDVTWDEACATTGEDGNGCGAAMLCAFCADSDGDGVSDETDVCCDTPTWLTVDEDGRPIGDYVKDRSFRSRNQAGTCRPTDFSIE